MNSTFHIRSKIRLSYSKAFLLYRGINHFETVNALYCDNTILRLEYDLVRGLRFVAISLKKYSKIS